MARPYLQRRLRVTLAVAYPALLASLALVSRRQSASPSTDRAIPRALEDYGTLLANTADGLVLSGISDERWSNRNFALLRRLHGAYFEAIDRSGVMADPGYAQSLLLAVTAPTTAGAAATLVPRGGDADCPPAEAIVSRFAGASRALFRAGR